MVFVTLLIIPLITATAAFIIFERRIVLKEFLIQIGIQLVIAGGCTGFLYYQNVMDTEVWNGVVASKAKERVSCEHSYPCNCHEVSCGKDCTTIHCDTCYEHLYDFDWAVYTTNQERLTIDRVDRQGVNEPARFTTVKMGEPTSISHTFVNYIKGAPDTLFRHQGLVEKFKDKLPSYPNWIYDYYRLDRLVLVNGASVPDGQVWNKQLSELNGALGRQKQVNIIILIVKNLPSDYQLALEQQWIGGKKNDVIVTLGVDDAAKIVWAGVSAWTDKALFKVKLRDDLVALGTLDREQILNLIHANVQQFYVRKHMSDFAYLRASVKPTMTQWIIAMVISLLLSIGLSVFFWNNDFEGENYRTRRYR